ncbi:hypothetical protein SISNIDRAFT_447490 [Sistotremastrum niveocremeum HHB9708]|uniref:G domain-containing protein n=2 Tax=Sistotremastrum niveocremeum HHB9708 TaxID=1314777 RepID=A0A164M808_9AGAM|nr:hypothetical protein SISNIDRAFT_447490 [Sistotremastrum niveocremeum HHB9708]
MSDSPSATLSPLTENDSNEHLPSYLDLRTERCERFRILLCGKSGVGKSSLVSKVFGEGLLDREVSDYTPGVHDIDHEITSEQNRRVILHDSRGLESGSSENLDTIRHFLKRRRNAGLSERLHVIWRVLQYCVEVPTSGERPFEGGDIRFFKDLKKQGKAGASVIIVFTKYDRLLYSEQDHKQQDLIAEGVPPPQAARSAREASVTLARGKFEACLQVMKSELPKIWDAYCRVSKDDAKSIHELIGCTTISLKQSSQILWATAQKHDVGLKLSGSSQASGNFELEEEHGSFSSSMHRMGTRLWGTPASIDTSLDRNVASSVRVGRNHHLGALFASAIPLHGVRRITTLNVLRLIHRDIVRIWNFSDPEGVLDGALFRRYVRALFVEPLVSPDLESPLTRGQDSPLGDSLMNFMMNPTLVQGISTALNAAGAILNEIALSTPATARILMAYVANLTLGMETLFHMIQRKEIVVITRTIVAEAYDTYYRSPTLKEVNMAVRDYIGDEEVFKAFRRDKAAQKVKDIIENCRCIPPERF